MIDNFGERRDTINAETNTGRFVFYKLPLNSPQFNIAGKASLMIGAVKAAPAVRLSNGSANCKGRLALKTESRNKQ